MARRRRKKKKSTRVLARKDRLFVFGMGSGAFVVCLYTYWDYIAPRAGLIVLLALLLLVAYGVFRLVRRHGKVIRREFLYLVRMRSKKRRDIAAQKPLEHQVSELFRSQGFHTQIVSMRGGRGVSIKMYRNGAHYAVQVQQQSLAEPVSEQEVRDFFERMSSLGYSHGYFVTSGRFAKGAHTFADSHSVVLVDSAGLLEMRERVGV